MRRSGVRFPVLAEFFTDNKCGEGYANFFAFTLSFFYPAVSLVSGSMPIAERNSRQKGDIFFITTTLYVVLMDVFFCCIHHKARLSGLMYRRRGKVAIGIGIGAAALGIGKGIFPAHNSLPSLRVLH